MSIIHHDFEIVGLIPARGGSKGIPLKNLQILYGQTSLLVDTIIQARLSSIQSIYVSSDLDDILEQATNFGCIPIKRPASIASDRASTDEVIKHFIDSIPPPQGRRIIVLLQCTYPFHTYISIDTVISELVSRIDLFDSIFAAAPTHSFLWSYNSSKSSIGLNHDSNQPRSRRQDLTSTQVVELGSTYAFTEEGFTKSLSRFCTNPSPVIVTDPVHLEIDNPSDLTLARLLSLPVKDMIYNFKRNSCFKALVVDCDGVLTNNRVSISSAGVESAQFNKYDSIAFSYLKSLSINILILSTESSDYVSCRASKLNIDCISGSRCKAYDLSKWSRANSTSYSEILYIGNDFNDLTVFPFVGLFCCPSDASSQVIGHSNYVTRAIGGEGVVREIASLFFGMK